PSRSCPIGTKRTRGSATFRLIAAFHTPAERTLTLTPPRALPWTMQAARLRGAHDAGGPAPPGAPEQPSQVGAATRAPPDPTPTPAAAVADVAALDRRCHHSGDPAALARPHERRSGPDAQLPAAAEGQDRGRTGEVGRDRQRRAHRRRPDRRHQVQ